MPLSRMPHEVELSNIFFRAIINVEVIKKEVEQDVELKKIIEEIQLDPLMHSKLSM